MLAVGDRCVPLVDLSERLGLRPVLLARRLLSVAVVQSGEHVVGMLVDGVADIVEAPCSAILPVAPAAGQHPAVRRITRFDARESELLDIDRLLGAMSLPG